MFNSVRAMRSVASSRSGFFAMTTAPRTFQFTIHKDRLIDAEAELYHFYGNAMAAWAHVESSLYYWFFYMTKMPDDMCRAIYYSARGFAARIEMLEAAIEHTGALSVTETVFLKEALKKARSYSWFRNKVAHGEPRLNVTKPPGEDFTASYTITQGKDTPAGSQEALTLSELDDAAYNIRVLALCIGDMLPILRRKNPQSPEECLSQVRTLPSEPNVKSAPTATGSAQQPQGPVHRNKKEYRARQARDKMPPEDAG